ncbi:IS3 family transposase, partial [uncultured Clostridium sp.]|uniref:IS3 family transposase n=1 Tax=uncultured Clostridium sp. TaxID=59620 RepID=UPI0025DF501D
INYNPMVNFLKLMHKSSKYIDFKDAKISIFEYIESWYNRKRIHSRIGYMTPQDYEDLITKSA